MIKLCRLTIVICLWVCLQAHPVSACRYNVRDTGFVDFGTEPYYLYGYVREDTPADIASAFRQISYAVLTDSNIEIEIINIDRQKDHPAIKYVDLKRIESFPAAVLVSPDGQSLLVSVTKPDQPFKRTLLVGLEDIVSSPKRDEIIRQVTEAYAAILLFEGLDQQENQKARRAGLNAIERIRRQMKLLPKTIAQPPVLVEISRQSFSQEKVLLWSLGLDADKINLPCAVVVYGRARWIGPLMKGEQISENILANILYVIGTDCECGLDRSWMQGTMLPVRWDEEARNRAAKSLDFDPENPMVKMEINRILRMGASSYPGMPFGYQELVVEFDSDSERETNEPVVEVHDITLPQPAAPNLASRPSVLAENEPTLQKSLYVIVGLVVLVVAVGLFIVLKAARKNL